MSGNKWVLTSLTDAKAYPAAELIGLYHERWEIELAYDEVKTHLLESEETIPAVRSMASRRRSGASC